VRNQEHPTALECYFLEAAAVCLLDDNSDLAGLVPIAAVDDALDLVWDVEDLLIAPVLAVVVDFGVFDFD
jgi:hypothetical protein